MNEPTPTPNSTDAGEALDPAITPDERNLRALIRKGRAPEALNLALRRFDASLLQQEFPLGTPPMEMILGARSTMSRRDLTLLLLLLRDYVTNLHQQMHGMEVQLAQFTAFCENQLPAEGDTAPKIEVVAR